MTDQPVYVDDKLFVGRLDEQERFRETLRTVLTSRDNSAPPFIFLIYGEGGMGKSQLTRRLDDIATTESPFERDCYTLRIDWELVRNDTPALRVAREQIHPEEVLAALHRAALDAGWGKHFEAYQKVIQQRQQAEQEVAKTLEQQKEQGQYAAIRDLGAAGLAKLVRLTLPVGETGENLSKALLAAGIQLGAEQAAKVREQADQFLKVRLKPELYDIYRLPHEQLARALGQGFRRISHDRPLVLLLDTYEIVAPTADTWLRQVIKVAGSQVVWVLAGRDNLASSRPGDRYVGYSAEFSRGLTSWDLQELAIQYVTEYVTDRAPHRPPSPEEAAALHRATLGVPLALRQAADLWAQGVPLAAITEGIPDYAPREELVRLMCERVLLHVEKGAAGQADRAALFALAMQPRPEAQVQAALLRPETGPFDLNSRLAELARCYSAVRLVGGAHLHQAMGEFVREYLLRTEVGHSDLVLSLAEQAAASLRASRAKLESGLFDLAERVESEDWQQASLDLVHWLFWHDEAAAWRELTPRLVEGLGYDQALAGGLVAVAERFKPKLSQDGRKRLKQLTLAPDNLDKMLTELERLDQKGHWLDDGNPDLTTERQTILRLWRGRWQASTAKNQEALQTYLLAERCLPAAVQNLRAQLAQALNDIGWKLGWERGQAIPSPNAELALSRAVILDEAEGGYWIGLGVMQYGLKKNLEAVDALCKGIELEGDKAYSLNWLGNVFSDLGRHDEAIAAYRQASDLDPKYASPWHGLGNVFSALGRHDEAISAYRQASDLDPKDAYPHSRLGTLFEILGRLEDALAEHQQAVNLAPQDASCRASLASVLHKLGREPEAREQLAQARELMAHEDEYNQACIETIAGNIELALELLAQAIAKSPAQKAWARRDPDLTLLHGHPRFEALVGQGEQPSLLAK